MNANGHTAGQTTFSGIAGNTYSEEWKKQRNVAMRILRSLGYGKHTIENKMIEEAKMLHDILNKTSKEPTDPEELLSISVSNVICSLIYGHRYDHDDEEFQTLTKVCILMLLILFRQIDYKLKLYMNGHVNTLNPAICSSMAAESSLEKVYSLMHFWQD